MEQGGSHISQHSLFMEMEAIEARCIEGMVNPTPYIFKPKP